MIANFSTNIGSECLENLTEMKAFILFIKLLLITCSNQQGQDCLGLVCKNNGTLEVSNCKCECPAQYSGLHCEYEIERSNWPKGPYAIPTPIDGCPESYTAGWTEGYVNISTRVPLEIWITQNTVTFDDDPGEVTQINDTVMFNIAEDRLHIPYTLGPYGRYTIQFNFCYKSKTHTNNGMDIWPTGNYFIYGTDDGCPTGFQDDNITISIPEVMSLSRDGDLPYMDISYEIIQVKLSLLVCQRIGDVNQSDTLFMAETPFILLKGYENNCTLFKGFNVTSESFDVAEKDKHESTHSVKGFTFNMCYYTPLDYIKNVVLEYAEKDDSETCQLIVSVRIYFQEGYDKVFSKYKKTMNVINLNRIDFTFKEAVENVPVFLSTDHVPWLLFDLKMTTPIRMLTTGLLYDPEGGDDQNDFRKYPELFVSNDKWSFLNNGALLCRVVTYRTIPNVYIHVFLKRMEGRYLSIVATQYKTDAMVMEYFLRMIVFSVVTQCGDDINELQVCHRELGMLDNLTEDYQLSASSWTLGHSPGMARQYMSGWCADTTDVNPYLQVDLIATTTINGITVINGYTDVIYEQQREFSRKIVPLGCKSFRLLYGNELKSLKEYNTVFKLDLSLPYTEPQTKIFRKPFLARYVRIYPEALPNSNNTACLRLELLGCAKTVLPSKQCENNSIIYTANKTSALLSLEDSTFGIGIIITPTWADCLDMCMQAAGNCNTFLYSNTYCYMMSPSKTSKYITFEDETDTILLTTTICLAEIGDYKPTVQLSTDLAIVPEINKDNLFPISEQGVFTSVGYPYHYFPDQLYMWNITLTDSAYIKLMFSNISLHVYKGVTYDDIAYCIDVIEIRYDTLEEETRHMIDYTLEKEAMHMIDYRMNGATPTIATDHTTLYVVLRTGYRISEKSQSGIGVRVIVKKDAVPNCFHTFNTDIGAECYMAKMTLGSHSYFGLSQTSTYYNWEIIVNDVTTIILKIIDFDVNCQRDASLKLRTENFFDTFNYKFCNKNRPVGPIKSTYNYMRIQYGTPSGDYQFYDGFYAEYSLRQVEPIIFVIASPMKVYPIGDVVGNSSDSSSDNVRAEYGKFCAEVFKKCYLIYPSSNRSWQEASDYCWSKGMDLVSFHSQLELQLLREALVNFTNHNIIQLKDKGFSYFRLPSMDPLLYSYIGLRRYTDKTGKLEELWEDDTPLTFTAWGHNEPLEVNRQQCTRMGFHLHNEVDTWETTYCDSMPGTAGYFICQESRSHSSENKGLRSNSSSLAPISDRAGTLFKCEDGTWTFPVSVCDGIPDCPDWSDEIKCTESAQGDESMFLCNDGRYIHLSYICNFIPDCYGGSDEYCEFPECLTSEYKCDNMQCIPSYRKCDAMLDCADGSDETLCDTCNTTVAFQCADLSCKPLSQVCDNHADCSDASDEQNCQPKPMSSCRAFWEAGYRENGTYNLVDGNAECQFYVQHSKNETIVKIQTLIHDVYVDYSEYDDTENAYPIEFDSTLLDRLKQDEVCLQKIEQICEPYLLRLSEHDGIYENILYTECICEMMIISHHNNKTNDFFRCSSLEDPTIEMDWFDYNVNLKTTNDRNIRYILGPAVCYSEITIATETIIACEHSQQLIPASRRCLYSTDTMGRIDGCRSLSHLQDCETFECPVNHVKCPNSFCLAIQHICDGTKNCPGGHDEENCWCMNNSAEIVIVFYASYLDVNIREAIYTLAKQLYRSSKVVRVLQLSSINNTTDITGASNDVLVFDETIDSHDERQNRYHIQDYAVHAKELINHIYESFTNKFVSNSIILIQDNRTALVELFQLFQYVEEDAFGTLFFSVNIDKNVSKKAEITKESYITHIKLRKNEDHVVIDPFLFEKLCKEPDYSTCNNMYKCASSLICIHLSQICDANLDCPYGDDEYTCQFTCPNKCTCKGLIIDCRNTQFQTEDFMAISGEARALDLSHNTEVYSVSFKTELQYLYRLNLSNSGLQIVDRNTFSKLRNLKSLDISYNKLRTIQTNTFHDLKALATLYLTGNNLLATMDQGSFNGLTAIEELTITGTLLTTVVTGTFSGLLLSKLDLSNNQISTIENLAFNNLAVKTIDISGNDITNFDKDMFAGVRDLQAIHSNAYKFCCIRPSTVQEIDCHPYKDEFSSCDDLMRNNVLQALLWVIGICALLGNGISLAYRFIHDRQRLKLGYGIFVTNLSVADFMMGIYLLIIAIADTVYRDRYIWNDDYWRNSIWCNIAGVLSTVASEASVMFICLITLDRFLVIKFPFGQIRFKPKIAVMFSLLSWVLVTLIAVFPLIFTDYFQNQFYTKSGVCLALPITRDRPPGWQYSVAIFIGFNFATFLLIAISQWLIYNEINRSRKRVKKQSTSRGNDLKIARNLLLVVTTDFLCWFPIGVMGLMALNGYVISGEVYAWAAVLILPINSAINPFLYTLSAVLNKRKFLPSIDEQSQASTIGSKFSDYGKGIMTILDSRIIRQPTTSMAVNTMPLGEYIDNNHVTPRDILTIAVQITCGIQYLHECELVLGKFDLNNVLAVSRINSLVFDYVQLQMKPTLCTANSQKIEDIYCLGIMIRKLLIKSTKEHC